MDNGNSVAFGSIFQAGCWDHDNNTGTASVPSVFKSTNEGGAWQRTALTTVAGEIKALVVASGNKNVLYAGGYTTNATNQNAFALFKTTNGGDNWNSLTVSSTTSWDQINAILIDPSNNNRVLLGTNRGVFVSTNAGSDWQSPSMWQYIQCLVVDSKSANKFYAGTNGSGVYVTTNSGTDWSELNTGLAVKNIQCMDIDPANNLLYIGTYGGGVYRMSLTTGVEDEPPSTEMPTQFVLCQNFPNPFNASTLISYCLYRSAAVHLSVVDLRGKTIKILVDAYETNGNKQAIWDGKDGSGKEVPSGIYLFRLATADRFEIRKMVYQK